MLATWPRSDVSNACDRRNDACCQLRAKRAARIIALYWYRIEASKRPPVLSRSTIFIGSFNLDPRLAKINTETGLYVESRELAEQLIAFMDEGVRAENSYQVVLDEEGNLVWVTEVDGEGVRLTKEPGASFTNNILTRIVQVLPIEDQL